MSVVDLVLLIACVSFAFAGYRQGFIIGFAAFAGFLVGGLVGIYLAPDVVKVVDGEVGQAILAIATVLGMATFGQVLGSAAGAWIRGFVTWQPGHAIDAVTGGLLGVISLLTVSWFIGSALASAPVPNLSQQVRQSEVLGFVDDLMPSGADRLYASLSRVLDQNGLTQVFRPFDNERIAKVEEPDSGPLAAAAIKAARASIVKVEGAARSCRKALEGSGFVYAPERVMTNAHVVAGVDEPTVSVGGVEEKLPGRIVLFDEDRDIAIIYVPGLKARALNLDFTGSRRDSAVVAGFPLNGPYRLEKARIRDEINARGPDIYNTGVVERNVFSIFARIEPGNSGGPLLSPDGDVYGLIFAKSVEDSQTGYALTAEEVQLDAERGRRATDKVSTRDCV
ncbi:MAG: MarP family serine protease [Sporichthyaceae bacterium]